MKNLYTKSTHSTPENFTKPNKKFKSRVIWATLALIGFIGLYLGLMIWFGIRSFHLFEFSVNSDEMPWLMMFSGVVLGFLAIFMFKSLFTFNRRKQEGLIELKESQEPDLFAYVHQLADESGAPRPNKIFISPRVNASVFYDLSLLNLLIPARKNLEIGIGLINTLNLGETKAVLAHEFGHFAQRSMLLGRYVYTAQKVAMAVVGKRDALDSFLIGLSSFDLRVAWIGWILSIMVWAMRSMIDVLFSLVVIAERALSREMEFQADKMAVALTGSDSLIVGLHKLRAADQGFSEALNVCHELLVKKKYPENFYVLQSNYIQRMRSVLDDETYGGQPELKKVKGKERVFTEQLVSPPEMWSTHPADNIREDNAKEVYIKSTPDERSSWELFADPVKIQQESTALILGDTDLTKMEKCSEEECIAFMDEKMFDWEYLNSKYQGAFHSRLSFTNFEYINEIYNNDVVFDNPRAEYEKLYPIGLRDKIIQHQTVSQEIQALIVVQNESITGERREIYHRGERIRRKEIKEILESLEREEEELRQELVAHDTLCRQLNYSVALKMHPKLASNLKSIAKLVHYAEHSHKDLVDMQGKLYNLIAVVTADGRVSESEMFDLLQEARNLRKLLWRVFDDAKKIKPGSQVQKHLGEESYNDLFEEYNHGEPDQTNIQKWIDFAPSWIDMALTALMKLRNASLEALLELEEQVKESCITSSKIPEFAVEEPFVVSNYSIMTPGNERKITYKLNLWNRFMAGVGFVPSVAKFAVSAGMIALAVWAGMFKDETSLYLSNNLDVSVNIEIDGEDYYLLPNSHRLIDISLGSHFIETETGDSEAIEEFEVTIEERIGAYVYNVGSAGYFVQYEVYYGVEGNKEDIVIGAQRLIHTRAEHILEEAPESVRSQYSLGTSRTVLNVMNPYGPYSFPELDLQTADAKRMTKNILKHSKPTTAYLNVWFYVGAGVKELRPYVLEWTKDKSTRVNAWRALQDAGEEDEIKKANERIHQEFLKDSENEDLSYLMARSIDDEEEKDKAFLEGFGKWPNHGWFAYASAHVLMEDRNWSEAYEAFEVASNQSHLYGSNFMMEFERVYRMVEEDVSKPCLALSNSPEIIAIRDVESGLVKDDPQQGMFYNIQKGEMTKVLNAIKGLRLNESEANYFKWYMAAFDGADDNLVNGLLQLDSEQLILDDWNLPIVLAVQAKGGVDFKFALEQFESIFVTEKDVGKTEAIIRCYQEGNISKATSILNSLNSFPVQLRLMLVGRIMLGEKEVPAEWNVMIDRMLFQFEKPYFNPTKQ